LKSGAAAALPPSVLDDLLPFLDRHEPPEVEQRLRVQHWRESEVALVGFGLGAMLYLLYLIGMRFYENPAFFKVISLLLFEALIAVLVIVAVVVVYLIYRRWARTFVAAGIAVLTVILFFNLHETSKSISEDRGPGYYRGGMQWITDNVRPGEMIFNTDWDDFPKMFYLDTAHAYVSGLDPTYLLDQNPELSKLYVDITLGNEKDPGPIIRDRFHARYVFSDNEEVHDNFYAAAMNSGWFDKVYEDGDCTVLRVREQKGEPPPEESDEPGPDETDDAPPAADEELPQ
jgi:hypothetical protein